jgi:ubiquinone/menaquinone biosynthesis C-methylase UbiE
MSYNSYKIPIYDPIVWYDKLWSNYKVYHAKLDQWIKNKWLQFFPKSINHMTILDIGGWDGRLVKYVSNISYDQYIILDWSQALLHSAPSSYNIKHIQGDLEQNRSIADNTIDVWLCFFVLWHLQILDHFFDELYRVTKALSTCIIQYHIESKPYLHQIWWQKYKIQTYNHHIDDIIQQAKFSWFDVYVHEIKEKNNLTSRLLICTHKSI